MDLDSFLELTNIIKNEKLRKRKEQLIKQGLDSDYPTEKRRDLHRAACASGDWKEYDEFVVKHEVAEEEIASRTVKDIAALAGVSEEIINNTTQYNALQMSTLPRMELALSYEGDSAELKTKSPLKLKKPTLSHKETVNC